MIAPMAASWLQKRAGVGTAFITRDEMGAMSFECFKGLLLSEATALDSGL